MTIDSTALFNDRAGHYAKYRPGYPEGVFAVLCTHVPVPADAADIGAGTGIFSRGLLRSGYRTVAVEPNAMMRAEAVAGNSTLRVVEGRGEATGIDAASVDLITVAQAFHWLDRDAARAEFRRIGRPSCCVAIVWNSRQFDASPFMRGYRTMLLNRAPEYQMMKNFWNDLDANVRSFFSSETVYHTFDNMQRISLEEMLGNLFSTSYVPGLGTVGHEELVTEAKRLFDVHQEDGTVGFALRTNLYLGRAD
jgi:ubiquinone/menaquinone biosynthesis C-methylase UbiE